MRKRFILQHRSSHEMVAGFNSQHMIIQTTKQLQLARKFSARANAEQFADRYSDAGFGFSKSDYTIKEVITS